MHRSPVCAISVTEDLGRTLRQSHRRPHVNAYRTIMWVNTYIAQLSAAQDEHYRSQECGPGHYGNRGAQENHKFCPPFLKVVVAP